MKATNYTPEQTVELVNAYTAAPTAETVALFADRFGKKAASIIAKLVREGVYVKKAYTSKTGAPAQSKDSIVAEIAAEVDSLTPEECDSLTKANKSALLKLLDAVK